MCAPFLSLSFVIGILRNTSTWNKNSASKYSEIHRMMTDWGPKHVVININVINLCYYFYLNCCVDGYKYTILNDTQQDATCKDLHFIVVWILGFVSSANHIVRTSLSPCLSQWLTHLLNILLLKFSFVLPYFSNSTQTAYRDSYKERGKVCWAGRNEQLQHRNKEPWVCFRLIVLVEPEFPLRFLSPNAVENSSEENTRDRVE
jgi:hypothetical protein